MNAITHHPMLRVLYSASVVRARLKNDQYREIAQRLYTKAGVCQIYGCSNHCPFMSSNSLTGARCDVFFVIAGGEQHHAHRDLYRHDLLHLLLRKP